MTYFLFFYNITICFASLCLCYAYAVLHRAHGARVFLFVAILFGVYFLDIIVLYMYDYIPEFEETFANIQVAAPYVYSSLSFVMLLLYRLILGEVVGKRLSHTEVPLWIACCVGAFCSWFIPDIEPSIAVELVFATVLRIWVVLFAVRGLTVAWTSCKRLIIVGVIIFLIVFIGCEAAESLVTIQDIAASASPLRRLPMEILGCACMVLGVAYLAYRKIAKRGDARATLVASIAQRYGLTKRETEILELLAAGLNNREIGQREYISVGTVKTHVHNTCAKLGIEGRSHVPAFFKQELRETLRRKV